MRAVYNNSCLSARNRLTYHDDRYTRLTPATYEAWAQLERESGQQLVYKPGILQLALKGETDVIMEEYATAMDRHHIPYDRLSSEQLRARYPQFTPPPNMVALYQKDGGLVDAALGNSTHVQLARGNGAVVLDLCPVLKISRTADGKMEVVTTKATFTCQRVIVTAGAWINRVLGSIGVQLPITVTQEQVTYFATPHIRDFTKDKFPVWIYHAKTNDFYGLPIYSNSGAKIGIDASGPVVTTDTRTFTPDPERVNACRQLLRDILPNVSGALACPYLRLSTLSHLTPPVIVALGVTVSDVFDCPYGLAPTHT
ncbi:hypothetical protein C0Q70_13075 [Pomacea canaliculata]|uniref:FAD dependent oxidoreductase domain-containing protein n=1 Tax=Pomacea canaliculata TaxID=400727 RepID=A0A2T7NW69_POMCA|nr:hypothetical protein C0Q70_13075 [Pomacea canaliculata]